MADLRQSPQYVKYMKETGWIVESADSCQIFIKKFPIFGSFIKIQRPQQIPFSEIDKIGKKHRAFVVKIEPRNAKNAKDLKKHGYKKDKSPYLPSKTIHLDLTQSEKQILSQMKKDARYGIRRAKKQDISGACFSPKLEIKIQKDKNLESFHQAWRKSTGWRRYIASLKTLKSLKGAFGKKSLFLVATTNRHTPSAKILAGAVILMTTASAYYYYAFTSGEGRKKFAQYLLVWKAIKLAKKQGCKIFDFEGIYDKRFPQKSWKGFTHFKKSFGGQEVEYPGCFSKYYHPLAKFLSW